MEKIVITGGEPLSGNITIGGSKNAILPIMAACILTDEAVHLTNVPNLQDIQTMIKVLESLGVKADISNLSQNKLTVCYEDINKNIAEYDLVRKMRASVLILGPLLARKKEASVSLPGGCAIGARPIDMHIDALKKLGAEFVLDSGYVNCKAPKGLKGNKIDLKKISVGASENIIMAASLASGESEINNIAIEPEVIDLIKCLKSMGSEIDFIGDRKILIQGKENLRGTTHEVIPDRIEAGTYMIAGALIGNNLKIQNIEPDHMQNILNVFEELKIDFKLNKDSISISKSDIEVGVNLQTEEYPGFPTDLQAQIMVLLSKSKKNSSIIENIFENRFMHVPELNRMGTQISIEGNKSIISPSSELIGAPVMATDLRASVSLVLAGLISKGETIINRIYHIDRGYEEIEKKISQCGGNIKRIK
ncbi:MAG: UDP-N-acetylglucosamine 1-carboxyvinyltransferase [Candidatus Pelagibacterales bacterium]|jgi:UDP-N-acetylglucosamine 1-carboxyvinyltransferase|tara:strand:- start:308 stop:1570 length:1263 start_codon:yes stop_codon:yes gene_type:complete